MKIRSRVRWRFARLAGLAVIFLVVSVAGAQPVPTIGVLRPAPMASTCTSSPGLSPARRSATTGMVAWFFALILVAAPPAPSLYNHHAK